jgi:hypothetical protein
MQLEECFLAVCGGSSVDSSRSWSASNDSCVGVRRPAAVFLSSRLCECMAKCCRQCCVLHMPHSLGSALTLCAAAAPCLTLPPIGCTSPCQCSYDCHNATPAVVLYRLKKMLPTGVYLTACANVGALRPSVLARAPGAIAALPTLFSLYSVVFAAHGVLFCRCLAMAAAVARNVSNLCNNLHKYIDPTTLTLQRRHGLHTGGDAAAQTFANVFQ